MRTKLAALLLAVLLLTGCVPYVRWQITTNIPQTQQMPALGRNLGRGDDEKIVEFRNLVQHAVVVADGDTVQPALARKRNDLAQAHAAVERPLGMNVQIEPQLHDPLPLLSAQTGSF